MQLETFGWAGFRELLCWFQNDEGGRGLAQ